MNKVLARMLCFSFLVVILFSYRFQSSAAGPNILYDFDNYETDASAFDLGIVSNSE